MIIVIFRFIVVPTISIFGESSSIESVESISNHQVHKIVLPGRNRPVDALKLLHNKKQKLEGRI